MKKYPADYFNVIQHTKPPAGGIIPFIKENNNLCFLLGKEVSCNKWSGFVGGSSEVDHDIYDTAVREFNEETCGIFKNYIQLIKTKIKKYGTP